MQNRIQPIDDSKKTVTALVQERVRQAILDGNLPPGLRIDQNQLANDLNVSLVPVREALKILEGEGFVQIIPRRGAFVTETSLADMEDLYFTREILEGQAAYHAANYLTAENIQRLEQLCAMMDDDLATHGYPEFMRHNRVFHFVIYDAAGSTYLSNLISGLWDLAERYRYRYLLLKNQGKSIQTDHRAILEACTTRNPKALRDSIVEHMRHTLTSLKTQIEESETKEN